MAKGNILDFVSFSQFKEDESWGKENVSDELGDAIQELILRLKEANPIQQQGLKNLN